MITAAKLARALASFPSEAQLYADDDGDLVIMDAADERRLGIIYITELNQIEDHRTGQRYDIC